MTENKPGLINKIFQAIKPIQKNEGTSLGVSEIESFKADYVLQDIYATSQNKKKLFIEYKEMSTYPEVAEAVDEVVSEAIFPDKSGQLVKLNILDTEILENENISKNLQKEFDFIINRVLDFNSNGADLFRKFYIEGEIYGELVLDPKHKEYGIRGINYLPSYSMRIQYDDNNEPEKYIQNLEGMHIGLQNVKNKNVSKEIPFAPSQIAYINSGLIDFKRNLVYSYLERAKIAYKQLKWMENALLVYRITRAPERRVFYIDVGKLTKNKADEYIQALVRKFKNKKIYNPSTGEVNLTKDTMCLSLDTEISLLDGRELKLSEIIDEFNEGKKLQTYSINEKNGEFIPGKIVWAGVTRKNAEVLEVTLDNGKKEIVTPDHKFILNDLSIKEAKDLVPGDSLRSIYRKSSTKNDNSWLPGYDMIFNEKNKKWEFTHRLVSESLDNLNKINNTVHHLDFDKKNNSFENLICLPFKEHIKHHSELSKRNWEDPEFRKKQKESHDKWLSSPEGQKFRKENGEKTSKLNKERKSHLAFVSYNNSDLHKEHNKIRSETMLLKWSDLEFKENFKKIKTIEYPINLLDYLKVHYLDCINEGKNNIGLEKFVNLLNNDFDLLDKFRKINEDKIIALGKYSEKNEGKLIFTPSNITKYLNIINIGTFVNFKEKFKVNHKVISVRKLNSKIDTGCITVETVKNKEYGHNFRLTSGIIVKNSMEEDFYFPTRGGEGGSRVDTLPGAANLNEIADVTYFLNKLYKALKIPVTRLNKEGIYDPGKSAAITREEIKFAKYISSIRNRFAEFIYQIFFTHIELRGHYKDLKLDRSKIAINFAESNSWKELKDLEMMRARIDIYKDMKDDKETFPTEWLLKNIMNLSDEEIVNIKEFKKKEIEWTNIDTTSKEGAGAPGEPGMTGETPVETPEEESSSSDVVTIEPKSKFLSDFDKIDNLILSSK